MSVLTLERITVQEDLAANRLDFVGQNSGVAHLSVSDGGPVGVSGSDLQIGTGQSIIDGSGTDRIEILSNFTLLNDDSGGLSIQLNSGNRMRYSAFSDAPFQLYDEEASATAVQYDTDASSGVLRTPNAGMRIEGGSSGVTSSSGGSAVEIFNFNNPSIYGYDRSTSSYTTLEIRGSLVDMSNGVGSDLRLATGQAIEDGSGTDRLVFDSGVTRFFDDSGKRVLLGNDGTETRLSAYSNQPVTIFDEEGVFTALEYQTSASSPGTLELTNADLLTQHVASFRPDGTVDSTVQINSGNFGYGGVDYGNNIKLLSDNSELIGQDSGGNQTTLT